ncbi:MAG: hypothetical protein V8Q84_01220 [Bilophila sp.]
MESIVFQATDVVRRFYDAYLRKRNLYAVTRCVTDDVRWIGTGAFERAEGVPTLPRHPARGA